MNALAKLDRARVMLAEARTLPEVKKIRDIAQAVKVYTRARGMGVDAQNNAARIVAEAERGMGQHQLKTEKNPGSRRYPKGTAKAEAPLTLKDLGISKKESARCQEIARLPEEKFHEYIDAVVESGQQLTTTGLATFAKQQRKVDHPIVLKVQHIQPETESPEKTLATQITNKLGRIQSRKSSIAVTVKIANGWTNLAIDYLDDSEVKALLEIL